MVKGTPVASGKVNSPASMIRVKGKLTLESGKLVSDYCCVKVDEDPGVGEFVMNGGTVEIIANEQGYTGLTFTIMNWGVATVNNGTHKGNVQSLSSSANNESKASTLTINGGSFDPANIYMIAYDTDYAPTVKIVNTITTLTVVNNSAPALGYEVSGPVEEGNYNVYTLAVPSGIDPTDPTSTQEVTVDTSLTAEEQEAAAIAAASVTVPDAAKTVVEESTYKSYFTYTATPTATEGVYEVAIANLNEDVVFPTSESAELTADLADVLDVAAGADVEITTAKPGLYYSIEAAENVGFTSGKVEGARELATTTTVAPKKPTVTGTPTAVFFRVKVSATQE